MNQPAGDLRHDPSTNMPPKSLPDEVKARHPDIFNRFDELMKLARTVPTKIADDETAGWVGDLLSSIRAWRAKADATRKVETEEWRGKVKTVNNTFNKPIEELDELRNRIAAANEEFLNEKLAREQAKLAEKAERERAESERRQREAAEAEERRVAANREAEEAEARRKAAETARLEEERKEREAKERADRARQERERIEAEQIERDEKELRDRDRDLHEAEMLLNRIENLDALKKQSSVSAERLDDMIATSGEIEVLLFRMQSSDRLLSEKTKRRVAQMKERLMAIRAGRAEQVRDEANQRRLEQEQAEAAERERQRQATERREAEAREEQLRQERLAKEAREAVKEAKGDERAAARDARDATKDATAAARESNQAMGAAVRHEQRADKAEAKAEGHAGDLVRTRGDYGSVSTLAKVWRWRIVDERLITQPQSDLRGNQFRAMLFPYIPRDVIESAIQKYMDAGGRTLPGVVFEEVHEGRTI